MRRLLLIILLLVVGCATWQPVGGLYTSEPHNFSVELPQGWMRFNTDEYLYITRDGTPLQWIIIKGGKIDEPFFHTKKRLTKGMLPQEAAEVIIDNMASDPSVLNFELIENTPANIGGFSGFKLVFTYKNKAGLKLKSIYYGFISGELYYGFRYTAPLRHYFDKDVKTFEEVLRSFKLIKTT